MPHVRNINPKNLVEAWDMTFITATKNFVSLLLKKERALGEVTPLISFTENILRYAPENEAFLA